MPTYGRVSRYGLDRVRFVARSHWAAGEKCEGCGDRAEQIAGAIRWTRRHADVPVPDYVAELQKPVRGLKIGVPRNISARDWTRSPKAVEKAIESLRSWAADRSGVVAAQRVRDSDLLHLWRLRKRRRTWRASTACATDIAPRMPVLFRKCIAETRDEGFGRGSKAAHHAGDICAERGLLRCVLSERRKGATLLTSDFDEAFKKVDAIVTPTQSDSCIQLGEKANDPVAMYLADIYTVTADLAGIPRDFGSVRRSREELPIGLQVLGKHFSEGTVFRAARAIEQGQVV